MKKTIKIIMVMALAVLFVVGCSRDRETTTILEDSHTGTGISGRMVHTLVATGDTIDTWETITHYDLEEYLEYYGYETTEDVREWFAGSGPDQSTVDGMYFELVDITDEYIITRIFFNYSEMSSEDLSMFIQGDVEANYVSLQATIDNIVSGGSTLVE